MSWQEELLNGIDIELKLNEPMSKHTSFRIGGPADVFAETKNMEQLKSLASFCRSHSIPLLIIGRGTNLLVKDEGYRGVVTKLSGDFNHIKFDGPSCGIEAGTGVALSRLSRLSAKNGLSGLEFAFGIPGSLGGALVMNAGTKAQAIGEIVSAVEAIDHSGNEITLTKKELEFGYRWSNLGKFLCLTKAYLQMRACPPQKAIELMNRIYRKKKTEQPLLSASAGCVFKNPPDVSAGKLIDECGLKGEQVGGAQVSTQHANFIINTGNATAKDVLNLIDKVRSIVKKRTGISLELELKVV